jgi:hypothetical protein
MDQFLKSLEKVQTAWGTGNFRAAFEDWMGTGSVTALNKAYTDLFGTSANLLKIMPNWADILLLIDNASKKAADAAKELTPAIIESTRATADMGGAMNAWGIYVQGTFARGMATTAASLEKNSRNINQFTRTVLDGGAATGGLADNTRRAAEAWDIFGNRTQRALEIFKKVEGLSTGRGGAGGGIPLVLQGDYSAQGSYMTAEQWAQYVARLIGQGGRNIVVINGDVYGFEDFTNAVAAANADILRRSPSPGGGGSHR